MEFKLSENCPAIASSSQIQLYKSKNEKGNEKGNEREAQIPSAIPPILRKFVLLFTLTN